MLCYRDFLCFYVLLLVCRDCSCLVVGAPSKITFPSPESIKSSKLLVIITHPPPPAPLLAAHLLALHPAAVSTSSVQTVHHTEPVIINHHHVSPHPASTVNGHSLGYGVATHVTSYHTYDSSHENLYTVHVGGFGVGLHIGGHGHGHGYFAVL